MATDFRTHSSTLHIINDWMSYQDALTCARIMYGAVGKAIESNSSEKRFLNADGQIIRMWCSYTNHWYVEFADDLVYPDWHDRIEPWNCAGYFDN